MSMKLGFYNHIGHFKTPPGFNSWLEYWEYRTGRKALGCKNTDCPNTTTRNALVGGHVDIPGYAGVYLIPLCVECNNYQNRKLMHGWDYDLVLVPAKLLILEN